jgi:hypothetical protein
MFHQVAREWADSVISRRVQLHAPAVVDGPTWLAHFNKVKPAYFFMCAFAML